MVTFNEFEPPRLPIEETFINRVRVSIRVSLLQNSKPWVLNQGEPCWTNFNLMYSRVETFLTIDPWQKRRHIFKFRQLYLPITKLYLRTGNEPTFHKIIFHFSQLFDSFRWLYFLKYMMLGYNLLNLLIHLVIKTIDSVFDFVIVFV